MKQIQIAVALFGLALSACGTQDGVSTASAASSNKPAPSAKPSASATTATTSSAAPSASAAGDDADPCKKHSLTLGGTGTNKDMCKYADEVLKATYTSKLEDEGAVFAITNPWSEDVNWLTAAVYYYDSAGKQLTVKVNDKESKSDLLSGVDVKIPGNKTTNVTLGLKKAELPNDVATVEVQILSFGWNLGDGKGAYFASTEPFKEYRAVNGGDGPTGIPQCDAYRQMLEECPKKLPDALASARKQLKGYNNAAPQVQKSMAEQLAKTCETAIEGIKDKCIPE